MDAKVNPPFPSPEETDPGLQAPGPPPAPAPGGRPLGKEQAPCAPHTPRLASLLVWAPTVELQTTGGCPRCRVGRLGFCSLGWFRGSPHLTVGTAPLFVTPYRAPGSGPTRLRGRCPPTRQPPTPVPKANLLARPSIIFFDFLINQR